MSLRVALCSKVKSLDEAGAKANLNRVLSYWGQTRNRVIYL
jgi:hypothetical protein